MAECTRDSVLQFIHDFRQQRQFGPTTREVAAGVGLASNSTAAMHLETLRNDGLLTWSRHEDGQMITRSVRLTDAGRRAVGERA